MAKTTGLTAELRRACMRCGCLPSAVSGHGGSNGVLGRRWSYGGGAGVARRELRAVMATAELRELGGCCWRCETTKETEAKQMGCAAECGRVLA